MPNLVRMILVLAILAGITYGGLYLVGELLEPSPRQMQTSLGKIKLSP